MTTKPTKSDRIPTPTMPTLCAAYLLVEAEQKQTPKGVNVRSRHLAAHLYGPSFTENLERGYEKRTKQFHEQDAAIDRALRQAATKGLMQFHSTEGWGITTKGREEATKSTNG